MEHVVDVADELVKVSMYPYFEVCHMVICCLSIRADLGQGTVFFSRRHPFACWLSSMLSMFSTTVLSNFMLNEPIVGAFSNTRHVLMASSVWYAMFYTPFDLTGRLCQFLPVRAILEASNELYRCHRVHHGVQLTARIYPSSYFAIVLMGLVQGNGFGLMRFLERMFRGANWAPSLTEFMQPSYATKFSLLASCVFLMDRKSDLMGSWQIPHNLVYMCLALFFVYFKLATLLFGMQDPFVPVENLMGAILFGGIWDAIALIMLNTSQRFTPTNPYPYPYSSYPHHHHAYGDGHHHHQYTAFAGANAGTGASFGVTSSSVSGGGISGGGGGGGTDLVGASLVSTVIPLASSSRADILRNGRMCTGVAKSPNKYHHSQ